MNDSWDVAMVEMGDMVEKAILEKSKHEMLVCYSAYELSDEDVPINNLNEVAIDGPVQLICSQSWIQDDGYEYESEIIESPTWLDLTLLANDMIHTTQDTHHVFLEAVNYIRDEKEYGVFDLVMGS